MKIHFSCPNCDTAYAAEIHQQGKKGNCKNCGSEIVVPTTKASNHISKNKTGRWKIIGIATIIGLIAFVVIMIKVPDQEKIQFEKAEFEFNNGNIILAKKLYTEFSKEHPTNQWRTISDKQLDKCDQIISLRTKVSEYLILNEFRPARDIYYQIHGLNNNAVDTVETFSEIRLREQKYLDQIKQNQIEERKRELQIKKQIEQRERSFIIDLTMFLENLRMLSEHHFESVNNFKKDTEGFNDIFAKAVHEWFSSSAVKEVNSHLEERYLRIKNPPPKYGKTVTEIENSYKAFNELMNTLTHLENYSLLTLRTQLAKLNNEINASINNLAIYLPKK